MNEVLNTKVSLGLASNLTVENEVERLHAGKADGISDRQLIDLFLNHEQENHEQEVRELAFEALVHRYRGLVLGVCRRTLGDDHDAEDAFQATFMILARKAKQIRNESTLAGWLHRVAYRLAIRIRSRQRPSCDWNLEWESLAVSESELQKAVQRDTYRAIDEEMDRLKPRLREFVILCTLQGMSYQQVARRLGVSRNQVKWGLAQAREKLRYRLAKRGLYFSVGLMSVVGTHLTAQRTASASLLQRTTDQSLLFADGSASEYVSSQSFAIANQGIQTMYLMKLKTSLLGCAILIALTVGTVAAATPEAWPIIAQNSSQEESAALSEANASISEQPLIAENGDYNEALAAYSAAAEANVALASGSAAQDDEAKQKAKQEAKAMLARAKEQLARAEAELANKLEQSGVERELLIERGLLGLLTEGDENAERYEELEQRVKEALQLAAERAQLDSKALQLDRMQLEKFQALYQAKMNELAELGQEKSSEMRALAERKIAAALLQQLGDSVHENALRELAQRQSESAWAELLDWRAQLEQSAAETLKSSEEMPKANRQMLTKVLEDKIVAQQQMIEELRAELQATREMLDQMRLKMEANPLSNEKLDKLDSSPSDDSVELSAAMLRPTKELLELRKNLANVRNAQLKLKREQARERAIQEEYLRDTLRELTLAQREASDDVDKSELKEKAGAIMEQLESLRSTASGEQARAAKAQADEALAIAQQAMERNLQQAEKADASDEEQQAAQEAAESKMRAFIEQQKIDSELMKEKAAQVRKTYEAQIAEARAQWEKQSVNLDKLQQEKDKLKLFAEKERAQLTDAKDSLADALAQIEELKAVIADLKQQLKDKEDE